MMKELYFVFFQFPDGEEIKVSSYGKGEAEAEEYARNFLRENEIDDKEMTLIKIEPYLPLGGDNGTPKL